MHCAAVFMCTFGCVGVKALRAYQGWFSIYFMIHEILNSLPKLRVPKGEANFILGYTF